MDSEYPPLPSSKVIEASTQDISLSDGEGVTQVSSGSETPNLVASAHVHDASYHNTQVIVSSGDLILEYASSSRAHTGTRTRWRVSSEGLMQSSPYFRALLDPNKFSEGRDFMKQRELRNLDVGSTANGDAGLSENHTSEQNAVPTMRLPDNHLSPRLGPDTVALFLQALSYTSFNDEEKKSFAAEARSQKPSFIADLIELADAFNSPDAVRDSLKRAGYTLGKPKLPMTRFTSAMLKLSESRIRQSIFIARFLNERTTFQMLTHALVVAGSRNWVNGLEGTEPGTPSWHYFSDGLEDELYYRRQSVLNTITDLQAHFLRIYGALEEPTLPKAGIFPSPSSVPRQYQCRCGLGNSSACDTFHLGQMTRFFSLRTKTIFIGSTLLDPDFNPDIEATDAESGSEAGTRPTDIASIISQLKQCPDYQIDSNHVACGIRRRFLPSLDCIEGFVGDERGLLGVNLSYWREQGSGCRGGGGGNWPHINGSWANRAHRRALVIDLRLARVTGIPLMSPGGLGAEYREEDARLLFTAKKRNWEA
ncbi:uncharacterized protein DSM5745_01970 [Aspergillus mulundensis]|uniref:BTB domain-containing protein n=1 Tax=Aspergillus mulundensis TaxID=1810919 RepID=A0A3D8SV85_9EURO|nr:Uncharacterized protein DSM5745_01970 [Aspergillus mulundensis]RDW90195.1 Uncharacterized protein DSM5745_01970 [Aspergillus mulundensis]